MSTVSSAERVVEELRVELFRQRISQYRLANETGMSQSKISRRLNGDVDPTLGEIECIARAAGLELDIVLREIQTTEPSSNPSDDTAAAPVPTSGAAAPSGAPSGGAS